MRLSLGAWWPEGRSSSSVSQFLPSCSWSACQMAVKWRDCYRGELSPWWFLQLCFYSVWGRWPAERGEQTLRCVQLNARLSAELCIPGLWHYYTTLWYLSFAVMCSWQTRLEGDESSVPRGPLVLFHPPELAAGLGQAFSHGIKRTSRCEIT